MWKVTEATGTSTHRVTNRPAKLRSSNEDLRMYIDLGVMLRARPTKALLFGKKAPVHHDIYAGWENPLKHSS